MKIFKRVLFRQHGLMTAWPMGLVIKSHSIGSIESDSLEKS